MARIITVTSGKGGVGKTNISVNLAVYLAQKGYRICLFDADLGLANINILLNLYPEYTLGDVIDGRKSLGEIVVRDKSGIDIIPGSSGVAKMADLSEEELNRMARSFGELSEYDYFIFDTSAGISKSVIAFCMSASEVLLVITPEPTSLTDAYALMKILSLNGFKKTAKVIVNQSKNPKHAQLAYQKLKDTVSKFLGIQLSPLGTISDDPRVVEAVTAQQPYITLYPNTAASKCLKTIADHLLEKEAASEIFTMDTFWSRCVSIFTSPLKMPVKKSEAAKEAALVPAEKPNVAQPPPLPRVEAAVGDTGMERLIQAVTAVTQELAGIRKALENGGGPVREKGNTSLGSGTRPIIPLDFEAFLKAKALNE